MSTRLNKDLAYSPRSTHINLLRYESVLFNDVIKEENINTLTVFPLRFMIITRKKKTFLLQ